MKKLKISFLVLFIFTACSASAQLSFGVKAGLNLSNARAGNETITLDTRINPGIHLGLLAAYMLNENMGLQSGLSFSREGYKVSTGAIDFPGLKFRSSSKINLNTLQVPLHFAYSMKLSEQCKITVHGGPYVAYILSGKRVDKAAASGSKENSSSKKSSNLYGKNSEFKRFDTGLGLGITVAYTKYFVELAYDLGLVNLWEDAKTNRYTNLRNTYLSVGYRF